MATHSPSVPGANLPGGLTPSVIGTQGGGIANQSVLKSIYDYDPFSFVRQVYQRHANFPSFRTLLKLMNAGRKVSAPTYGHYEQDWRDNVLKVGSIDTASTGAGTSVILVLHSSMMYNAGATVSGSAAQSSYPRVGQIVHFNNGKRGIITAKNTTVSPHKITLKPLLAAVELDNTTVAANEIAAILDNAWGEGTGLPTGLTPRLIKYTNTMQIIKEAGGITGTEASNMTFPQWTATEDGSIWVPIQADMMERFERANCYALLVGTQIDNVTDTTNYTGHDVAVQGTEGLVPFVETWGHTDTYTQNSYAVADFDAMALTFEQERIGERQVVTLDGFSIYQQTENELQSLLNANLTVELMKTLGGDAGVPADAMQPFMSEDFSFYIGFRAIRKSGYDFFFRQLHEFNSYVGLGASGFDYPERRLAFPLGYTQNKYNGEKTRYVGYDYKGLGRYSRENVFSQFGGVGVAGTGAILDQAVSQYDALQAGLVAELGGHFACANKAIIQTPA